MGQSPRTQTRAAVSMTVPPLWPLAAQSGRRHDRKQFSRLTSGEIERWV
jgi:hypothetical protein